MSGSKYLTRRQLVEFLNQSGFPVSLSTIAKLSMPSRREGPPHEGVWGNRILYDREKVLRWARSRLRSAPSSQVSA